MSDTDLTIRMLRKIDAKVDALTTRFDGFEAKVEMRFSIIEHTLNALAGQMHAFTQFMKSIDARVRKLERAAK